MLWKEWAGYYAVSSYQIPHDAEYYAFRQAAGLLDISPLFKYSVTGLDAAAFLARIMVKDITKLKVGRVAYCCWCDDAGKVVDDGTVMRRGEDEFFVTSADPCYSWFSRFTRGYEVQVEDISGQVAGLALQGPTSRNILQNLCGDSVETLRFFRTTATAVEDFNIHISRTGYTGDLGYEVWVDNQHALRLWDLIMEAGKHYNIRPAGLDALDMTRVEAGLILKDVDYFNALHVLIDDRTSSPYEISLGWIVDLDRDPFIGQKALQQEKENGSQWALMGIELDWNEIEALYARYGLPPEVPHHAWRSSIPIYTDKSKARQIGYATSGSWSPILKKYIALATIRSEYKEPGTVVEMEISVEHIRHTVRAWVRDPQFYNPARKRSNPQPKPASV
ncbi:MAG: aminomethyltransferase family protein [Saprospiraceae bacterium]|nr:aminomethyltransferase family protein [Saprospiraceae bacterium]